MPRPHTSRVRTGHGVVAGSLDTTPGHNPSPALAPPEAAGSKTASATGGTRRAGGPSIGEAVDSVTEPFEERDLGDRLEHEPYDEGGGHDDGRDPHPPQ